MGSVATFAIREGVPVAGPEGSVALVMGSVKELSWAWAKESVWRFPSVSMTLAQEKEWLSELVGWLAQELIPLQLVLLMAPEL